MKLTTVTSRLVAVGLLLITASAAAIKKNTPLRNEIFVATTSATRPAIIPVNSVTRILSCSDRP